MNSVCLSQELQLAERQADYLPPTMDGGLHGMPTDNFTSVTHILELIKIQYTLVWISENKKLNG